MNEIYINNDQKELQNKKTQILDKSCIDYCFLLNLNSQNCEKVTQIYQEEDGIAGFKVYLTAPVQNGVNWVQNKH